MNELNWMVLMEDYHLDGEWGGGEHCKGRPFSQAKFYREEWTQSSEYALDGTPDPRLFQMFLYLRFCLRSQRELCPWMGLVNEVSLLWYNYIETLPAPGSQLLLTHPSSQLLARQKSMLYGWASARIYIFRSRDGLPWRGMVRPFNFKHDRDSPCLKAISQEVRNPSPESLSLSLQRALGRVPWEGHQEECLGESVMS